jgi:hypothetical protein
VIRVQPACGELRLLALECRKVGAAGRDLLVDFLVHGIDQLASQREAEHITRLATRLPRRFHQCRFGINRTGHRVDPLARGKLLFSLGQRGSFRFNIDQEREQTASLVERRLDILSQHLNLGRLAKRLESSVSVFQPCTGFIELELDVIPDLSRFLLADEARVDDRQLRGAIHDFGHEVRVVELTFDENDGGVAHFFDGHDRAEKPAGRDVARRLVQLKLFHDSCRDSSVRDKRNEIGDRRGVDRSFQFRPTDGQRHLGFVGRGATDRPHERDNAAERTDRENEDPAAPERQSNFAKVDRGVLDVRITVRHIRRTDGGGWMTHQSGSSVLRQGTSVPFKASELIRDPRRALFDVLRKWLHDESCAEGGPDRSFPPGAGVRQRPSDTRQEHP